VFERRLDLYGACTISLGIAFYLVHNTVQTKATEVAPTHAPLPLPCNASHGPSARRWGAAAGGRPSRWLGYPARHRGIRLGFALLGAWLPLQLAAAACNERR